MCQIFSISNLLIISWYIPDDSGDNFSKCSKLKAKCVICHHFQNESSSDLVAIVTELNCRPSCYQGHIIMKMIMYMRMDNHEVNGINTCISACDSYGVV